MNLSTSRELSENLIQLLESTELGTNGARYIHLDVRKRINETDNPLSFYIERNNTIIANITFCQRDFAYYLRYFTFNKSYQNKKSKKDVKREKKSAFEERIEQVFTGLINESPAHPLYAYIDIENSRSRMFSARFGFKSFSHILSRTYSRINPKRAANAFISEDWSEVSQMVKQDYSLNQFYYDTHIKKPPFIVLKNSKGQPIACAKFTKVHWQIKRLPGKLGGILVKVLPFIPFINKIIKPNDHLFIVPDIVVSVNNSTKDIEALFDSALDIYNVKSLIWFVDPNQMVYSRHQSKIRWGILDKIIGAKRVHVVTRNLAGTYAENRPVFVSAFDLI